MPVVSSFDLSGRVALLTGATGHLGQAVARGLCEAGALVLVNGRSSERVSQQVKTLCGQGWSVESAAFDITNTRQRRQAIEELADKYGRLDVLINNASGVGTSKGFAAFRRAYQVAVISVWGLVQDALELLTAAAARNARGASIINVASMYGIVSPDFRIYSAITPPNPVFYGPAKAGLIQLTRYLACELGPQRIRVNAVSPGPFPNPTVVGIDPAFGERLGNKNPLGRIGQPDELIGPVVFLASDASSYVTGTNLIVDGGWTAW